MIDLDKLEALAKSATPGPWRHYKARLRQGYATVVNEVQPEEGEPVVRWSGFDGMRKTKTAVTNDARFIAAANPSTVLELIAMVRELAVVSIPVIKEGAKILAWASEDGRVQPASAMETARRVGGATASASKPYTIPLVEAAALAAPASEPMRKALERIARWHGEFPATGKTWQDGTPTSYAAEYGSNGERNYMRQVALDALSATAPVADTAPIPEGWKLVPIEPTDDMEVAFAEAWFSKARPIDDCQMADAYRDMLAAAPAPGEPQ